MDIALRQDSSSYSFRGASFNIINHFLQCLRQTPRACALDAHPDAVHLSTPPCFAHKPLFLAKLEHAVEEQNVFTFPRLGSPCAATMPPAPRAAPPPSSSHLPVLDGRLGTALLASVLFLVLWASPLPLLALAPFSFPFSFSFPFPFPASAGRPGNSFKPCSSAVVKDNATPPPSIPQVAATAPSVLLTLLPSPSGLLDAAFDLCLTQRPRMFAEFTQPGIQQKPFAPCLMQTPLARAFVLQAGTVQSNLTVCL